MKKYLFLLLGCFSMSCAVEFVIAPNEIIAGGISGLAVVLSTQFDINKDLFIWTINTLLMVYAYFFISKGYALNSFIGSIILFPLFIYLLPTIKVFEEPLLAAVVGGVLSGIGVFFLYLSNGSTGGTTIVGMIIKQIFDTKYALSVAIADGFIILIGFFVYGLTSTIYALIMVFIMTMTAEYLENGFKRVKVIHLLCDNIKDVKIEIEELFPSVKVIGVNDSDNQITLLAKATMLQKIREYVNERDISMYTTNATSTEGELFSIFENAGK